MTLYHKPLAKSAPDQFGFVACFETLFCELQKDVFLDFIEHCEVTVVLIFQSVYISMYLTITFWHVSQNHFCRLYKRFVIQGHKCLTSTKPYSVWKKLTEEIASPASIGLSPVLYIKHYHWLNRSIF